MLIAVATVLANWQSVLRAIHLASCKIESILYECVSKTNPNSTAKLPKPKEEPVPLPQTLVRIPTQHAGPLVAQSTSGSVAD